MDFKQKMANWGNRINDELDKYITEHTGLGSNLQKAMKYSLMAGGKRLRPILAFAVCEVLDGSIEDVIPYACAIEMIHTYSLIHDDLPSMDNDDFRRGMPTSHKMFGEALAILAGDALLNKAYEIMLKHTYSDESRFKPGLGAMKIIADSAGADGMIRGQVIDIEAEGCDTSVEILETMHRCKTGALIKAPVLTSALICGATDSEYKKLEEYAENIGLAFQIKDDIMDVQSSSSQLGKTTGKDALNKKATYVTLLGVTKADELLNKTIADALKSLECFGEKADFLRSLAVFIKDRKS
jgi:geranylgeranyl diphosphate synthase type II